MAVLNSEIVTKLRLPDVSDKPIAQAAEPLTATPDAFAAYIRSENDKWAKVVRQANIVAE